MVWFVEERTASSSAWMPVLYREKPTLDKNMRVGATNSRARSAPKEVAAKHERLSLTAIRGIYGGSNDEIKREDDQ